MPNVSTCNNFDWATFTISKTQDEDQIGKKNNNSAVSNYIFLDFFAN